ncbi:MAG: YabP/YqfC family sporulation protein [Lachnospiraceae bacterium]|nr:YabP/YqfC family sporulation protein [Lachnospiraceae bacterium]
MKKTSKHKQNKKELQPLYLYMRQTEKNRKKEYEQFLESASEHLSIPKDVIAGQAIISMTGNHSLRVANYRAVEEYSTEQVKLSLGRKSLVVTGSHLLMEYFRKDEIKIVGNISNISFV